MSKEMITTVHTSDLFQDSMNYMKKRCASQENKQAQLQLFRQGVRIWNRYFQGKELRIASRSFGRACIRENAFYLEGQCIECSVLAQIKQETLTGCVVYAFHGIDIPAEEEEMNELDRFFVNAWQTALLDGTRAWLLRCLQRRQQHGYIAASLGPGFYGMPIEAMEKLLSVLPAQEAGIRMTEDGKMEPLWSVIGIFLQSDEPIALPQGACVYCRGTANCQMCILR